MRSVLWLWNFEIFTDFFGEEVVDLEAIPPQNRPFVKELLTRSHPSGSFRDMLDKMLDGPYRIQREALPAGLPGIAGRSVETQKIGDEVEIVVRDAHGRELKRIPVDDDFDPERLAREIAPDAPPSSRRALVKLLGQMLFLTVVFFAFLRLWEVTDRTFWVRKIYELSQDIRARNTGGVLAWLVDMDLHLFWVEPLYPAIDWFIGQLSRDQAALLARRIAEIAVRIQGGAPVAPKPGTPAPQPMPQKPPPTRHNRIYHVPVDPPAPPPVSPPPGPKTFAELTKADLLWRLREEERSLRRDETELETTRGRLAWHRWLRNQGAPDVDDEIADFEETIRRLVDRIAQRRTRMDAVDEAANDPHREPGRIIDLAALPKAAKPRSPDIEEERTILVRIAEREARIDELVKRLTKQPPGASSERTLLERYLRETERERDERQAELDALRRARARVEADALGLDGLVSSDGAKGRVEDMESDSYRLVSDSENAPWRQSTRKLHQLDLLGMWSELQNGYRHGIDVTGLAHHHGIDLNTPLDRNLEQMLPRDLEGFIGCLSDVVDDLRDARLAQLGQPGWGPFLEVVSERNEGPVPLIETDGV